MRYLAMHDSLTGLANRASLTETLTKMLSPSPSPVTVGLVLIDLENFKGINDKLGQQGGDEVLRRVSNQLTELAPPGAVVGRLAGDDFLIVVEGSDAALAAANVAKCVTDTIKHSPLIVDGRSVSLGASVGVAIAHSASTRSMSYL